MPPSAEPVAGKGRDGRELREWLEERGTGPVIPSRKTRKIRYHYDRAVYRERNIIERMFCCLKDRRCIATRFERDIKRHGSYRTRRSPHLVAIMIQTLVPTHRRPSRAHNGQTPTGLTAWCENRPAHAACGKWQPGGALPRRFRVGIPAAGRIGTKRARHAQIVAIVEFAIVPEAKLRAGADRVLQFGLYHLDLATAGEPPASGHVRWAALRPSRKAPLIPTARASEPEH